MHGFKDSAGLKADRFLAAVTAVDYLLISTDLVATAGTRHCITQPGLVKTRQSSFYYKEVQRSTGKQQQEGLQPCTALHTWGTAALCNSCSVMEQILCFRMLMGALPCIKPVSRSHECIGDMIRRWEPSPDRLPSQQRPKALMMCTILQCTVQGHKHAACMLLKAVPAAAQVVNHRGQLPVLRPQP
ncbi:hypothetical protein WJX74_004832 [Apatococcus lobatus]|uniref:Uncharacterized protein n=1 Tax=Apatococcus lobatus TaxID=904363 RepID=A0AAW1RFN6_9CHLO